MVDIEAEIVCDAVEIDVCRPGVVPDVKLSVDHADMERYKIGSKHTYEVWKTESSSRRTGVDIFLREV